MVGIEQEFIAGAKKLNYSATYSSRLGALKDKRDTQLKNILTRDQYIKLGIVENDKIKNVPVRF